MTSLAHSGSPRAALTLLLLAPLVVAGCNSTHQPIGVPDSKPVPVDAGGKQTSVVDSKQGPPGGKDTKPDDKPPVEPPPLEKPPFKDPPPPQTIVFTARLEGDAIVVDAIGNKQLFVESCSGAIVLLKQEGDAFVAPRDERPPPYNSPGYYLDGKFVAPSFNLGCDVAACFPLQVANGIRVGLAYEYAKTGTKPPPADATPAPGAEALPDQVDVIETRPLSGLVLITLKYFEDDACLRTSGITLEFTIPAPEHGVCCSIGVAGCSSTGPGGGWAPSLDACKPWNTDNDVMSVLKTDPRGCAQLINDYALCCGCQLEDGGI